VNALTLTLNNFLGVFSLGYTNLAPATINLALTLLAIELVLFGIYFAFGAKNFADIFFKVIFIGFWWWLINAFPSLMTMAMNSFISWGAVAGGAAPNATSSLMLDPSAIAGFGQVASDPIFREMERFGLSDIGSKIIYGILGLIVIGLFFVIAIQVFITILEFYLVVALVSVLLPFAFIKKTAFLAEKAIGSVINFGIKLMVLAFIITVAQPVLSGLIISGPVTLNTVFAMILTVGALAVLVLHAPGVAAGIMSGSPSLSGGSVATSAMAGGMVGSAATSGAVAATLAATKLGGEGIKGSAALYGGAKTGATLKHAASLTAGHGSFATGANTALGAASGARSILARRARLGSTGFGASVARSFESGSQAALGEPKRSTTSGSSTTPSKKAPAWAATSLANLSEAVRLSSHAGGPTGGGANFQL